MRACGRRGTVQSGGFLLFCGIGGAQRCVMGSRFVPVIILALFLSAPAWAQTQQSGGQAAVNPSATLNHRVSNAQVVLYWNCTRPEPGVVRLDGVVYSPYFSDVRFMEFELVGLNPQDAVVSHVTGGLPDIQLRTNQTSPFRLDLRTAGTEARFDLFYRYRSQGNLRSEGSLPVLLASTLGPEAFLLAQATTRQFMVRDACSETQHLTPKPAR